LAGEQSGRHQGDIAQFWVAEQAWAGRRELARNYLQRDIKLLFGKSGMYCAFPECMNRLVAPETGNDSEAILGFIAHIVAHSDIGPRADPSFPKDERDRYSNLILLCGHHHTLVDAQDAKYTVTEMKRWKREKEAWVEDRLTAGMTAIRFAELEIVCRGIASGTAISSSPLTAVPPKLKMEQNELTDVSAYRMTMGLMQAGQVGQYLQEVNTRIDAEFSQRLRHGFVTEYRRLRGVPLRGDALFLAMHTFALESACKPDSDFNERFILGSAALAVLCHLFEVCDVFEVPSDVDS
jgi:hypothetical protein